MAEKRKAPKGTVKKVLSFIGIYKFRILLSLICAAVSVGATLYIPLLFGNALDEIKENGDFSLEAIAEILIKAFIWIAVCGIVTWIMNTVNNKITFYVSRDIRNTAFRKINILPLNYLDTHPTGDTLSRVITDVDQFADGLLMGFTQLFTGLLTIFGTLSILFFLNFRIALVVLLLTPVSLFVARFIANHTFDFFKSQSLIRGKQTAIIDETLGNLKTVKAFSKEEDRLKSFDETNSALQKASLNAIFYSSLTNPATRFVNSLVYAATAFVGALAVFSGSGTLTLLITKQFFARMVLRLFQLPKSSQILPKVFCLNHFLKVWQNITLLILQKKSLVVLQKMLLNARLMVVRFHLDIRLMLTNIIK